MLQNTYVDFFLAKVATVGDHIHFGFFGRIPHEVTFKVDGIGRGSINQVSVGQGLGQQCAYIFKPFKRGRTFHFFGEGLLSIVEAITFLNQSVAKP